jgi:hypothetical protein
MNGYPRSLSPEILEDPRIAALSDSEFRVWVSCNLMADSRGNLRGNPHRIKAAIYWHSVHARPLNVEEILSSLYQKWLLEQYISGGEEYIRVCDWDRYNKEHSGTSRPIPLAPFQKPEPPGWVYFIQAREGGPIKIGWTYDTGKRLIGLQCGSPQALVLLASESGARSDEQALHLRFSESRIYGEWFSETPELLALIDKLRSP